MRQLAGLAAAILFLVGSSAPALAADVTASFTPPAPPTTVRGCGLPTAPALWQVPIVGHALGVTLNKDGSRLYVSRHLLGDQSGIGIISVYETATMTEMTSMQVPYNYSYAGKVHLNPSETKGYIPINGSEVQIFDTATNLMTTTIPLFSNPDAIAFSPDGSRAYVQHYWGQLTVIDTATETVIDSRAMVDQHGTFRDLIMDPSGAYAYIGGRSHASVHVLDLATLTIVASIPVGDAVERMDISHDGSILYVRVPNGTTVVDLSSRTVLDRIPAVGYDRIQLSPSGKRAYVARTGGAITALDLTTNTNICSLWLTPERSTATDLAVSPDGRTIYMGSREETLTALRLPEERNPTFSDVPPSAMFHREISWLAAAGITTGYGDGSFRPLDPVRRNAMAAFLYRFHGSPDFTPPATSPFTDIQSGDMFYKEITWLASNKITQGWPDGTYRPFEPVSRAAMAAFMYRMTFHENFVPPTTSPFSDLTPADMFYREITFIKERGIATGWSHDGTYRPTQAINRDAMAAFLLRLNPWVYAQR